MPGDVPRTATGLAHGRVSAPTHFSAKRLEASDPRIAHPRLGRIKSNLNPAGVNRIKHFVAQVDVTKGFQQATGKIFQAPEQLSGRSSKLGRRGTSRLLTSRICRMMCAICSK